jgi:hypothetical protein
MKRTFLVLSLLLCLFLAACGGPPAPTPAIPNSNPTSGTTSTATSSALILHVTRTDPSPTDTLGPLDKTVTDPQTVQNLYHTARSLPAYPVGASISQSCLNDTGVIYHLDFLQGSTEVQHMNLDPGNCKILFLSQTDLRQVSNSFLTMLQQALQLHSLTADGA